MDNRNYWEKEEFEDLVSKSLISMYETKIQKSCLKVPKFIKPTDEDIRHLRNFGSYFAPEDRYSSLNRIDLVNDGLPKEACWAYDPTGTYEGQPKEDLLEGEYFRLNYIKLINNVPLSILDKNGLRCNVKENKVYKVLAFSCTQNKGFHLMKSYVYVNTEGLSFDTYARSPKGKLITLAHGGLGEEISDIGWVNATVGFYQDRRYLWNVTANEGIAKATFGVYPEQIKSLFYAREMPMTETGRKRPILHWVAAHNRRIKSGIDVDIDTHLRGINEFVYQGTKFTITRPIKGEV